MNLSILDKIMAIFKYFASSFLGIELCFIILLCFLFLLFNIKRKNNIVKVVIPLFFVSILLFISGGFHNYAKESIHHFVKFFMQYYYFPSMSLYYISIVGVTILLIYTILKDEMPKIKRITNYVFFSIIYLCFLGVMSYVIQGNISLTLDASIYADDLILSFIQISNFILFLWLIFTLFYYLYCCFKRKFD